MAYNRPDAESLVSAFAASDFSRDEESWNEAVEEDRGPDELAIPQPDEQGNYSTPVLRRLLMAFHEYDAGEIKKKEVLLLLDRAQDVIAKMMAGQQAYIEQGLDDPDNPIVQAMMGGFEQHTAAIDLLKQHITTDDAAARKKGLALLQEATNRLVDAYAFFQRLRVANMLVYCPACGAENKKGAPKCVACVAALPAVVVEQESRLLAVAAEGVLQADSAVPIKTPNYERIERAYAAWESHQMEDRGLAAEIRAVEANMTAHRKANETERTDVSDLSEDEQKVMTRLLDQVDHALDANIWALNKMLCYFDDGNVDNLRQGFDSFQVATRQMVEAFMASQSLIGQGGGE